MITLLSSKIELEIADHFQDNYDITEPQTDFECSFKFDNAEIIVPYYLIHDCISYKNNEISATKNGASYSTDDRDHFRIRRVDVNPNKRTLQQEIDLILEHEQNKLNERDDRLNICDNYKDFL